MSAEIQWSDDIDESELWSFEERRFHVDGVEFVSTLEHRSKFPGFCIKKQPALVEATATLLREFEGGNIVELGISQGGSTALAALVANPRKLVAVELSDEPIEELQDLLDETGASDRVHTYFGVDQADRARLVQILDDEFGSEPLDLVIDDASHLLEPTRASFEVLFPRLRPGGLFIIEDWNWQHLQARAFQAAIDTPGSAMQAEFQRRLRAALADESSPEHEVFTDWMAQQESGTRTSSLGMGGKDLLTMLVIELLFARAWSDDVVSRLDVLDLWVVVHRGPADLDPTTFRVDDIAHDHFGIVARAMR
jgi:predicted O-methyltransferase YrrM